jgi:hypothetical protein
VPHPLALSCEASLSRVPSFSCRAFSGPRRLDSRGKIDVTLKKRRISLAGYAAKKTRIPIRVIVPSEERERRALSLSFMAPPKK